MTLKDFEKNISTAILERGYKYYVKKRILSLEEDTDGTWLAEVSGKEIYYVSLKISGIKINSWDCDCPFDEGICKHVTAVLYALSENELLKTKPAKKDQAKNNKTKMIDSVFNRITKEEMKEFILFLFSNNRRIKNEFLAYFAEYIDENPGTKYKTVIKSYIRSAQDKYGFVDYRSANSLTRELGNLLNKAQELLEKRNLIESLAICKAMIEEVPLLAQHMDDSSGRIYELMNFSFDLFSQIIQQAPPLLKDELFQYCVEKYSEEMYHDYDLGDEFLHLLPELITIEEQEKQYLKMIDDQIEKEKKLAHSDYKISHLLQTKIDYLMSHDMTEQAWRLVEENRQFPKFMELLVDKAMKKKDYLSAVKLCFEGIKIAEAKNHSGTVNNWNEILLTIYEKTKNIVEIRKISRKLFFEKDYSLKHYKKLKSTYVQNEWAEICEGIIEDIKGKNNIGGYYNAQILADIFVEENYKERLLKLMQINSDKIRFVDQYAEQLKKYYPDELISLYAIGIKNLANILVEIIMRKLHTFLKNYKKIWAVKKKLNQ